MLINRRDIQHFLDDVRERLTGRLYLVGESSQVYEGWTTWTDAIDFFLEVDNRAAFELPGDLPLREEYPGDVIPLPRGHRERARLADASSKLEIYHFDPYSAAFRYLARGDEPDYHLVLAYIRHGWIEVAEMERLLEELMPRFSMETIQQDPAEFRRRYKGVLQMQRFRVQSSGFKVEGVL